MKVDPAARDAGLGRRLAALVLDAALALVAFAALNLLLFRSGVMAALLPDPDMPMLELWLSPAPAAFATALLAGAILACWRHLGGTPGALLMGMNIIADDGRRPGWGCAGRRLLLALPAIGVLWAYGGRPALHDRLSATRLVVEDEMLIVTARDPGLPGT